MTTKPFIAILMGSASDTEVMQRTADVLTGFQVPHEMHILSAHRTPEQLRGYVEDAEGRGCAVFIAAAGMAAHLAGAVAALSSRPVIGVPLDASSLGGLDSLLATVQMPAGVPVATVALGKAGAGNAAYLALQILALGDEELAMRLEKERQKRAATVLEADQKLQQERSGG